MTPTALTTALIGALVMLPGTAAQADFTGTWVLDASRSEGLPEGMGQSTMTVRQSGDRIEIDCCSRPGPLPAWCPMSTASTSSPPCRTSSVVPLLGDDGIPSALEVDVPVLGMEALAGLVPVEAGGGGLPPTLWLALGLAFIGGLLLNLMPCVFPVVSLKVPGFVRLAGERPAEVRRHGFSFAAGVLVAFWALAGLLLLPSARS
jgi:hypothetical protein